MEAVADSVHDPHMHEDTLGTPDEMMEMLRETRLPSIPDEVFNTEHPDIMICENWHKNTAAAVLGGLQTDPQFHANGIRFDWLLRLVLSKSAGRAKPTRFELSRVLNIGLGKADVLRLEDPNEDLFCELICTSRGNFRIFPGQWESAGPFTQTLIDAFESLPDGEIKSSALTATYGLLKLSDELASRANVNNNTRSGGEPQAEIELPTPTDLRQLASRVRFTTAELSQRRVTEATLSPFILESEQFQYVSDRPIGDTPLEFHPLLNVAGDFVLVSPTNVSTAIRSVLISTAMRHGMGEAFQDAILRRQEAHTKESRFWPSGDIPLSQPNRFFIRTTIGEYDRGHYLQIIQLPGNFEDFPSKAFASEQPLTPEATSFIKTQIERFWTFIAKREDVRDLATVLLLSGWGSPQRIIPAIAKESAPAGWRLIGISFADAGVMGVVPDTRLTDLIRVLRQEERLNAQGFEFQHVNGLLNLLGFWKTTGGNLIPEHLHEMRPPSIIGFPTDELLALRIDATRRRDRRALPTPDGESKIVERMEWSDSLESIYASRSDVANGRLSGAILKGDRVWWIQSGSTLREHREWQYRLWHAALKWVNAVGEAVLERFPEHFSVGARAVFLVAPERSVFEDIRFSQDVPLSETIQLRSTPEGAAIEVLPSWAPYLRLRENDAEVALVATIFKGLAIPSSDLALSDLQDTILQALGTRDWRWLHARRTVRIEDRLLASGLTDDFRAIPYSAHALVKCGSIWGFRDRSLGARVEGKQQCLEFILEYCDGILRSLIEEVRKFERPSICIMSAKRYQDARAEQSRWRNTIRAMRAIHGASADAEAFERQSEINGVIRAAKVICEIAASERPIAKAKIPTRIELDELFAKALLIFGNGQLYGAIVNELISPEIRISPAGDLLTERDTLANMLRPGVEWIVRKRFNEAAEAYGTPTEASSSDRKALDPLLREALETEYRASTEGLFDLPFVLAQLAEEQNSPVLVLTRSELSERLASHEQFPDKDASQLLERLTLPCRNGWFDLPLGLRRADFDFTKFDRPWSLINRPLLALDDSSNPRLLLSPAFVSDAILYSLSGLMDGTLNERYWVSNTARRYAGEQGRITGDKFEEDLVQRLRDLHLEVIPRCKLSTVLNKKVPPELGAIDALAITPDRATVWVIEAKNLRLCRTEAEAAARMSDYRGAYVTDEQGRRRPDKMLRHLRRARYMREHRERLPARLRLSGVPNVRGLLVVESPQPMNFHTLPTDMDARCVFLDAIAQFPFFETS